MPSRHERETPSGPIELNVGQIRVLVDVNIIDLEILVVYDHNICYKIE